MADSDNSRTLSTVTGGEIHFLTVWTFAASRMLLASIFNPLRRADCCSQWTREGRFAKLNERRPQIKALPLRSVHSWPIRFEPPEFMANNRPRLGNQSFRSDMTGNCCFLPTFWASEEGPFSGMMAKAPLMFGRLQNAPTGLEYLWPRDPPCIADLS